MERGKNCVERNGSKRLLRSLGGGLRSWLAVRETRTAALNLTAPPLLRLAAPATGDPRRCGGVDEAACGARKESRRAEPAASGRKVASVAEGTPPRARVPGIRLSHPGTRPLRPMARGRSSADVRVHRTSSDEAKTPSEAAERSRTRTGVHSAADAGARFRSQWGGSPPRAPGTGPTLTPPRQARRASAGAPRVCSR